MREELPVTTQEAREQLTGELGTVPTVILPTPSEVPTQPALGPTPPSAAPVSVSPEPVQVSFPDLVSGPIRQLPQRIGNYEVLEEIARGGMGVVYKARQVSLGRLVALKVIPGDDGNNRTALERFEREAHAAAALDHPDIVPIYETGTFDTYNYFAMALVDGPSLAALVKRDGLLPFERAVSIMLCMCEAMVHAHSKGILHRDLKPENVLLDAASGRPRLTDFGLAKWIREDNGLTVPGQILGTPSYMAPEQAKGEAALTPAVDIYALGGILYYLLTGQPPFRGNSVLATLVRVVQEPPVRPRQINRAVPPELEAICLRCLEKDPARRFTSVQLLADALLQYSMAVWGPIPSGVRSRLSGQIALPPQQRTPFLPLAACAALLGVLAVAALFSVTRWGQRTDPTTAGEPIVALPPTNSSASVVAVKPQPPKELQRDFDLKVTMAGDGTGSVEGPKVLTVGEPVLLTVQVQRDAYVGLWSINADGTTVQLFPNKHQPDSFVKAGEVRRVPGDHRYMITATPASDSEWIHAAASTKPWQTPEGREAGPFLVLQTQNSQHAARERLRGLVLEDRSVEQRRSAGVAVAEQTLFYIVRPKPMPERGSYHFVPMFLLPSVSAVAQTPDREETARKAVQDALDKYRAGNLLAAERLYRDGLRSANVEIQRLCYDRLLEIYVRLGRNDQAVQIGSTYRDWLKNRGEQDRLGQLSLLLGQSYLALGHLKSAESHLAEALQARPTLPPFQQLAAVADQARCAERLREDERAGKLWGQVKVQALKLLDAPESVLPPNQRIECVWQLSDAYRFQGKPRDAIAQLEALLQRAEKNPDVLTRRDTLRRLATHHAANEDFKAAEKVLRDALTAQDQFDKLDRLPRGDLLREIAEMLGRQGNHKEAAKVRQEASREYLAIWQESPRTNSVKAGDAFWRLQRLYQGAREYKQALQLSTTQAEEWIREPLVLPRLQVEQGSLHLVLGEYEAARKLLESAIAALEEQKPVNLIELPRALNSLAIVEQGVGRTAEAEALGQKCLALYKTNNLPDDLSLVEAYSLLGTVATMNGNHALAIERFREGNERCRKLGTSAIRQQCNLQLNIALLHKAQGEDAEALKLCLAAFDLYRRFSDPDSLGETGFHGALATLYLSQGKFDDSARHAEALATLCTKFEIKTGALVVTQKHCRALRHLSRGEYDTAEKLWREVLEMQQAEKLTLLMPRTLNYLGFTAQLKKQVDEAEKYLKQACELQKNNPQAVVATHYVSLWRLARVKSQQGKGNEARALLQQAVEVVEAARLRVYGDSQQRASFFARFEGAIEDLVDSCVKDGLIEQACVFAARGRSRTLLDQFELAGIDPRQHLTGERGEKLKKEEAELRTRVSSIRARAQLIPLEDAGKEEAKKLVQELDEAQKAYAEVWREVLNASPVYRNLTSAQQLEQTLPTIRKQALSGKTWMLLYWVGRERSYVFLVGSEKQKPEVFPLNVPADAVARLATLEPKLIARSPSRGLEIVPLAKPPQGVQTVTLNQPLARVLVDGYRHTIQDKNFRPTRGLRIESLEEKDSLAVEIPADVFLPEALRKRLKALAPEQLLVIPDGALHQMPLEALVVKGGIQPVYALDELPPLIYAPSAASLAHLLARPRKPANEKPTLLTVGDVAYPRDPRTPLPKDDSQIKTLIDLRAQLEKLEYSGEESLRIRKHFAVEKTKALEGKQATEKEVVASMAGRNVIHLAAHGFADERLGNLFGALALAAPAPGATPNSNDDGLLCLFEIYQLPLQDCELAVLSACVTNVGPQSPLEAGVTVANGFLTAGAQRVVASHWYVNDESTSLLMEAFFKELRNKVGKQVSHAEALQRARKAVRASKTQDWSSPVYWAPFVILGTGD